MASKVEICNLTSQRLGVGPVTTIPGETPQGKAYNSVYDLLRQSELRKHPWNFAISRTTLAADTIKPAFDWDNRFLLPSDCLKVLKREQEVSDWVIEGGYIYSNNSIEYLRYVSDVTDTGRFDPLFVTALSALMAAELCKSLVDSNTDKRIFIEEYKMAIREAKKANAIENKAYNFPTDSWITARL